MRRCILLLLAMAVLGCGDEDTINPQDRVVAVGTYDYEGRWLHPVTMEWDTIRGQLVLEATTPDSVHGHWAIAGYVTDSTAGYWNENAYVIAAVTVDGAITVTNRVARIGSPSELTCSLSFRELWGPQAETVTTGGTCEADHAP